MQRARGKLAPGFDPGVPCWSQMHPTFGSVQSFQIPPALDWLKGFSGFVSPLANGYDAANPTAPILGDCGIVGIYRFIQMEQWVTTDKFLSGDILLPCVLQAYQEIGGWVPGNPATDRGVVLLNALKFWMAKGVPMPDGTRHKIVGFFQLDHRNDNDLREAIAVCGGIYPGQVIPNLWDSSQPGDIWDLEGPPGGGHCDPSFAYSPTGYTMESWAMRFSETLRAKDEYMDESWAPISPTWAKATGRTPFGMTLQEVSNACKRIAV